MPDVISGRNLHQVNFDIPVKAEQTFSRNSHYDTKNFMEFSFSFLRVAMLVLYVHSITRVLLALKAAILTTVLSLQTILGQMLCIPDIK